LPAHADAVLTASSVIVVAGTEEQLLQLNAMFVIYWANNNPVVVLGGGKVGRAVMEALKERGISVHAVDRDRAVAESLEGLADKIIVGDAADRNVLMEAGLDQAPSVVLTTNDDTINIYLAIYCRRLNPKLRIVSRITYERNLEAIHRAGADFVLSYASLGVKSLMAILQRRPLVILGEGADVFVLKVPRGLAGVTLSDSGIGAQTGLTVIAVQKGVEVTTNPVPSTRLQSDQELVAIGSREQRDLFQRKFCGK
jgi:Trk K+ transport system NAD-binding subunit